MEIIDLIQSWGVAIISLLSLIIAIISLIQSGKAQKLQNKVNELDLKIKTAEIGKIEKKKAEESMICVEARLISLGQGKHHMKVWNSGNATAFNVNVRFADNPEIVLLADDKLPYDVLEPKKSFELSLIVHMASAHKAKIITEWDDADKQHHTKEQISSW